MRQVKKKKLCEAKTRCSQYFTGSGLLHSGSTAQGARASWLNNNSPWVRLLVLKTAAVCHGAKGFMEACLSMYLWTSTPRTVLAPLQCAVCKWFWANHLRGESLHTQVSGSMLHESLSTSGLFAVITGLINPGWMVSVMYPHFQITSLFKLRVA